MNSDSVRVTVANKLAELTGDFLVRNTLGHKNVTYAFKDDRAIERAKQVVYAPSLEWEKTLLAGLQWNKAAEGNLDRALEPLVMALPVGFLLNYLYRIIDSILQKNPQNVTFYQEQALVILRLYWNALIKAIMKEPRKELRETLDIAIKDGSIGVLPTDEVALRELLHKRFTTKVPRRPST
jgi:hypothetical protein